MTGIEQLLSNSPPPASAAKGDLRAAQLLLAGADIRYPPEYWELLDAYGAGKFHGVLEILSPASPDFLYYFSLFALQMKTARPHQAWDFEFGEWLPVAFDREYVLHVPSVGASSSGVLFLCSAGMEHEYAVADMSIGDFLVGYPTAEFQEWIYGPAEELVPNEQIGFSPSVELWRPALEKILEMASEAALADISDLYQRLKECWPTDSV